ncbi:attractin-like protein 1 isoform X2 [Clavelina lepadiformis]|uniref:attractin-like protein 1 isoform X2 n=1 Tax=Clavelina lepadiformis TaxID=159417 RepID=UPI004042FFC6
MWRIIFVLFVAVGSLQAKECSEGYVGNKCQHCEGRFISNETSGTVVDGSDLHFALDCLGIIKPTEMSNSSTLRVRFDQISGPCDCEFLNVFDGDGVNGPLLATFHGNVMPTNTPEVISNSGSVTLQFLNDGRDFSSREYSISYEVDNCTIPCDTDDQWRSQGRASAANAIADGFIYIFGGFTFHQTETWQTFIRFNLTTSDPSNVTSLNLVAVEAVKVNGTIPPTRRDHTLVAWNGFLIMYGGAFSDQTITNESLKYDLSLRQWSSMNVSSTFGTALPPLMGHSAHVTTVNGSKEVMLVFFGYHPEWGISPFVFQLDLDEMVWSEVRTNGAKPVPTYAHASALDNFKNVIYLHGGFNYERSRNNLYSFDVNKSTWKVLPSSTEPRYLHSMTFLNGHLTVYGGRINENDESCNGPVCNNLQDTAFDIGCKVWRNITVHDSDRYGHTVAKLNNQSMLIYGGYDGTILGDFVFYEFDLCEVLHEDDCVNSSHCFWDKECKLLCPDQSTSCEELCTSLKDRHDCFSSSCSCCHNGSVCFYSSSASCSAVSSIEQTPYCPTLDNCATCNDAGCDWNHSSSLCQPLENGNETLQNGCNTPCIDLTSCSECGFRSYCSWCETTSTCFPVDYKRIYYPYGSCLSFVGEGSDNSCEDDDMDPCLQYQNCDDCFKDERCGWCDLGSDTGYGTCLMGSSQAPMNASSCPTEQWNYLTCPECQCNGHSTCEPSAPTNCTECNRGTTGTTCEKCDAFFYGDPTNGKNCTECECNDHADSCSEFGSCLCQVEGVVGRNCDRCNNNGFGGDPVNDTCFYHIAVMNKYIYPFQSSSNAYPRQVNFDNCPPIETSVGVNVESSVPVNVIIATNATAYYANFYGNVTFHGNDTIFGNYTNVTDVSLTLYQNDFNFGGTYRPCVRIFVSNIMIGNTVTVWLVQNPTNIGLLVAVFLVCFVSLLLLALIVWKGNNIIMNMRRRRNVRVEMERLAARPMAVVNFDYMNDQAVKEDDKEASTLSAEFCGNGEAMICSAVLCLPSCGDSEMLRELVLGSALIKKPRNIQVPGPDEAASPGSSSNLSGVFQSAVSRVTHRMRPNRSIDGFDNPAMNMQNEA